MNARADRAAIMTPSELLPPALSAWWRWTWQTLTRGFLGSLIPVALMIFVGVSPHVPRWAKVTVIVAISVLMVVGYLWLTLFVMRTRVFSRPVRLKNGSSVMFFVHKRGEALSLSTGMPASVGWALIWAVSWRGTVINLALKSAMAGLLFLGLPSIAGGFLSFFASFAVQIAAFWWFFVQSYGKTMVEVVPVDV